MATRSSLAYCDAALENASHRVQSLQAAAHSDKKVAANVERENHARSHGQRQRQIAVGILHFAGGKGDVVPGVGREERSDLRDRKMVSAPTQTVGPPAPTCTACCTPSPALCQKLP